MFIAVLRITRLIYALGDATVTRGRVRVLIVIGRVVCDYSSGCNVHRLPPFATFANMDEPLRLPYLPRWYANRNQYIFGALILG